jgi:pSer/pThr/pTyr-binding forkhead associated (FHA) protein
LIILNVGIAALQRRKSNITRARGSALIACFLSIFLLFCAFIWYYFRFRTQQGQLTVGELWGVLVYALAVGWLLPACVTVICWLCARRSVAQGNTPQKEVARLSAPKQGKSPVPATVQPPRHQPGVQSPFVFRDDIPWGWLEYCNGNFQGQRLALKRAVVTIGRDENCDIWLDDDMASRHHAELAWCQQQICLTDCNSLNGVLLNGHQIKGTVQMNSQDELQIGEQRFLFIQAEQKVVQDEQYDPLVNHTWRSTHDLQMDTSSPLPAAAYLNNPGSQQGQETPPHNQVVETDHILSSAQDAECKEDEPPALIIRSGLQAGQSFWLLPPVVTIGRSEECLLVLHDESVALMQAQIYHQPYGDYLQALTQESEVSVNNVPVPSQGVHLLRAGDMIRFGKVLCEYLVPQATDSGMIPSPHSAKSLSGPVPLRLPSRMKPD